MRDGTVPSLVAGGRCYSPGPGRLRYHARLVSRGGVSLDLARQVLTHGITTVAERFTPVWVRPGRGNNPKCQT